MLLENAKFERKCSRNFYKSERIMLAEMKFGHLPLTTERGDIYPYIFGMGHFSDRCENDRFIFTPKTEYKAGCARLIGRFNPWSTYDILPDKLVDGAKVGVYISWDKTLVVYARLQGDICEYYYRFSGKTEKIGEFKYREGTRFLFTFHNANMIDAYYSYDGVITPVASTKVEGCECLIEEKVFSSCDAALYVEADKEISVREMINYLDSGIMQADVKPVKYEDGTVLIEDGKIFLTYTSRCESGGMQQIASYRLSTCEFRLEGALLFDCGDGRWCGDVATTLIRDRNAGLWRIWVCAFSHGHVLAYGHTPADPRHGINVIDVKPLPAAYGEYDFGGLHGDEDPDLYFDKKSGYWYLAICRSDPAIKNYRYYFFRSKRPNADFEFVAKTDESEETTGGSFVRVGDKIYFAFGRSFSETAKYDYYSFPDFKKLGELRPNFIDGGFRGWGTVMEIPCGTRKRLLWVTFDRTRGSDYNWSYGNFYFFETPTYKD